MRDALRLGVVEQRAIDVDPEAARLRGPYRRDGALVDAFFAHRAVMHLAVAVQMHRPHEIRARAEQAEPLLQQQRIRAQVDELPPRHDAGNDGVDFLVQQRLSAGDGDHGGAAFVDRREALLDREALIQDFVGIIDLAAAGARQVAAKQRLEHEHQRVASASRQLLADDVGADARLLQEGYRHDGC